MINVKKNRWIVPIVLSLLALAVIIIALVVTHFSKKKTITCSTSFPSGTCSITTQICSNGKCVEKTSLPCSDSNGNGICSNLGDRCINGKCLNPLKKKPCVPACIPLSQICVDGTCVEKNTLPCDASNTSGYCPKTGDICNTKGDCVPTKCNPSTDVWRTYPNLELLGGSDQLVEVDTVAECEMKCMANTDCSSAVIENIPDSKAQKKVCWLKNKPTNVVYNTSRKALVRTGLLQCENPTYSWFNFQNFGSDGWDMIHLTDVKNVSECQTKCQMTKGCVGVVNIGNECWLKNNINQIDSKSGQNFSLFLPSF